MEPLLQLSWVVFQVQYFPILISKQMERGSLQLLFTYMHSMAGVSVPVCRVQSVNPLSCCILVECVYALSLCVCNLSSALMTDST